MTNFYNEHVYPHLAHFCFYIRKDLYHLEEHTNCGHEGTNNSIKHSGAPVVPQNKLDRSVEIVFLNTEVCSKELMVKLCRKSNSQKLWSKTPTSEYITDITDSIVSCEWKNGKNNYRATCCSQNRWLVAYDKNEVEEETFDAWSGWADDSDVLEKKDDEETANFGIRPNLFTKCSVS